jgi:ribosomal protein S17E
MKEKFEENIRKDLEDNKVVVNSIERMNIWKCTM